MNAAVSTTTYTECPQGGVPSQGISTNTVPANAIPANAIPANAIPANAVPAHVAVSDILYILQNSSASALDKRRGSTRTYDSLFTEWIAGKTNLKPTTKYKYEYLYQLHVKPYIGDKSLCDITAKDISQLVQDKKAVLATAVVRDIASCIIRQSLHYAEGLGYIERNVARFVDIPTVSQNHGRALTNTEINALRQTAHASHRLGIAVDLLIYTGMRKGELLALTWDDIDMDNKEIHVNKSWIRVCTNGNARGELTTPKTKKSIRVIAVPSVLIERLRSYKERETEEGRGDRKIVLCQRYEDKHLSPNNFERLFRQWKDAAGVGKEIHIHSLRHTYCTLMNEAGVDNWTLIQQTGHTDTRMLEMVYLHQRTKEAQHHAADKLEGKLKELKMA